jgi:hypothetical protein
VASGIYSWQNKTKAVNLSTRIGFSMIAFTLNECVIGGFLNDKISEGVKICESKFYACLVVAPRCFFRGHYLHSQAFVNLRSIMVLA